MKSEITHNLLKISKTRMGGGKIQLPNLLTVLIICALACACSKQPATDTQTTYLHAIGISYNLDF